MLGHVSAAMTLDVYADLFDDDLDVLAQRLDSVAFCVFFIVLPKCSRKIWVV
jgi:hypothetical protein